MYVDFEKNGNLMKVLLKLIKNYLLVGEQFYSWPAMVLVVCYFGIGFIVDPSTYEKWGKIAAQLCGICWGMGY